MSRVRQQLIEETRGQMADLAVVTVGVLDSEITASAVSLIKAGRVVLTSVSRSDEHSISLTGSPMVGWHKRIQGSLAGGSNPIFEIPPVSGPKSGHRTRPDHHAALLCSSRSTTAITTCSRARTSAAWSSTRAESRRDDYIIGSELRGRGEAKAEQRRLMPARRTSSTFSTPAWPAAASPHK